METLKQIEPSRPLLKLMEGGLAPDAQPLRGLGYATVFRQLVCIDGTTGVQSTWQKAGDRPAFKLPLMLDKGV